jgi:hypothetical protein
MATASETVLLNGGQLVSIHALRLLWGFEDRGCDVRESHDGSLFVGPRAQLTAEDTGDIRRHRDELLALVRACDAVQ